MPGIKSLVTKLKNKNQPQDTKNIPTISPPIQHPQPDPVPQADPKNSQVEPESLKNEHIVRGGNQFSAMPKTQEYKPPPTQPSTTENNTGFHISDPPQRVPTPKQKKLLTPGKTILFIILLIIMIIITIGATLVATEYTIWDPPQNIKNILETAFSGGKK